MFHVDNLLTIEYIMKTAAIVLVTSLLSTTAWAGNNANNSGDKYGSHSAINSPQIGLVNLGQSSDNNNISFNRTNNYTTNQGGTGLGLGVGIGRGGQGGNANATGGNANATGGNSSSQAAGGSANNELSNNVTVQSSKRAAFAPGLGGMASGPCTGISAGLTLGFPGFGGGLQGSNEDEQCTLRENIRIVSQFDQELAQEMLNDLKGVQEAKARLNRETKVAQRPYWCEGRNLRFASLKDQQVCGYRQ